MEHGDFTAANILIGEQGRAYVLDWEFSRERGSPLFDLCFFLLSNAMRGDDPERSLHDTLSGRSRYAGLWKQVLDQFCGPSNVAEESLLAYMPYAALRILVRYHYQFGYNFTLYRRIFGYMVEKKLFEL